MKVAAILGEGKGGLVDQPDPEPKEDFVLVKVHLVPICTEYKGFQRGRVSDHLGHEAVGEVVEIAQPGQVKVGDRVVVQCNDGCGRGSLCHAGDHIHCQSGVGPGSRQPTYAQYLLKKDWLCSPIPDDISYKHAGMALCGLGPSLGAMQQIRVEATDTILITGLGPVGLGGVINGSYRGARVIAISDRADILERAEARIQLPAGIPEWLSPIVAVVPGQLWASALARAKGIDPDRPRGLSKVTLTR